MSSCIACAGGYASAKQEADWQDQDQEDKGGAPASRKRGKVESLDREAGLDLSEHHPKDAVRRFFSRDARRPATAEDYFYNTIGTNEGCVTELVTPAFHNRIYRGDPCETPKKAEASAAQRFCDDPKARFAASMLPPQKYKCRTHARGAGKKRQLRAARQGQKLRQRENQRTEQILQHFKASGCRSRADGNR